MAATGTPLAMMGLGGFDPKNVMSQAAIDLGLGDQLKQQVQQQLDQRKKVLGNTPVGALGSNDMSPAALALYGKVQGF